jgi:hypothetical protein
MIFDLDIHRSANILIHEDGADANLATVRRHNGRFPWGQVPGGPGTARAENPIGEVI